MMVNKPTSCRLSKLYRYLTRTLKLGGLILVVLMIVTPARNVVFRNVIPGNWVKYNSAFLISMLFDSQNFPVDSTPKGPSPVEVAVDFRDIKTKFRHDSLFPEFTKVKNRLKEAAIHDITAQRQLDILSLFDPKISKDDYAVLQFTLDVFVRACHQAKLTYFLVGGTFLGALRHHGMIPWDDDYDIAMKASEWVRIRNVLGNIEGFELYAPSDSQWKFYIKDLPEFGKPFKWPNVDIFFYEEDDTYMWSVTWGIKYSLLYLKSEAYPLFYRPYEYWHLPVPKAAHRIASLEFGPEYLSACATATYIHKTNEELSGSQVAVISCENLHAVFPFVFHHSSSLDNTVREELRIGKKSIGNYTVPAQRSSF